MIHVSIYIVFREHVARSRGQPSHIRSIAAPHSEWPSILSKKLALLVFFFPMGILKFSKFQRHFPDPNTSRQRLELVLVRFIA